MCIVALLRGNFNWLSLPLQGRANSDLWPQLGPFTFTLKNTFPFFLSPTWDGGVMKIPEVLSRCQSSRSLTSIPVSKLFLDFGLHQVVFIIIPALITLPLLHCYLFALTCTRCNRWAHFSFLISVCSCEPQQPGPDPERPRRTMEDLKEPWRTLKNPEGADLRVPRRETSSHVYYKKGLKRISRSCGVSCLAYNDSSWLFLTATFQHHPCPPTPTEPSHPRLHTAQSSRPRCLWLWIVEWKITFN